jgi:hypothetical protein
VRLPRDAEIGILANPTAHRETGCARGYGGEDLATLDAGRATAALNGWFFHWTEDGAASNGLLWSDGRTLSPIEDPANPDMRGDRLAVFARDGFHEVRIADLPVAWSDPGFVDALRARVPSMTAAMQLLAAEDPLWGCPEDRAAPDAWKCQRQPVAMLCARADGGVSFLAAEPALYADLRETLTRGPCPIRCAHLYFLDGGHSTQLATRDAPGARWTYRYTFAEHEARAGCPAHRPVQHWIVAR